MSTDRLDFDSERNLLTLGDRRVVFHCHHYNLFLQRTIEDGLGTQSAQSLQVAAGMEATRSMLSALYAKDPAASFLDKLVLARKLFGSLGFGQAETSSLTPNGGGVRLITSHYAIGWKAKWGAAEHPVCYFPVGFWMAALAAAAGLAPERLQGRERSCAALGAAVCELEIEVL